MTSPLSDNPAVANPSLSAPASVIAGIVGQVLSLCGAIVQSVLFVSGEIELGHIVNAAIVVFVTILGVVAIVLGVIAARQVGSRKVLAGIGIGLGASLLVTTLATVLFALVALVQS